MNKQPILMFFLFLLFFTMPLCANIDAQIDAIQKAPAEERFKLMNAFKKEIIHMQETERINALKKLRSLTHSPHTKRALKEMHRHTNVSHTHNRRHIQKTRERADQNNEIEEYIENRTEENIENETENNIEDEHDDDD